MDIDQIMPPRPGFYNFVTQHVDPQPHLKSADQIFNEQIWEKVNINLV